LFAACDCPELKLYSKFQIGHYTGLVVTSFSWFICKICCSGWNCCTFHSFQSLDSKI